MKIGIDTFGCDHGRSGLGLYLLALASHLPQTEGIEYELFGPEMDRYTYRSENSKLSYASVMIPDSTAADRLWHWYRAPRFSVSRGYNATLFAAGARVLPPSFKVPGVAVVNDVFSAQTETASSIFFKRYMLKGLKRVTGIIAASQFIKKDLVSFGIAADKITVIHNGIDHSLFYPRTGLGDTVDIKPFAIKRPYLIYASRLQGAGKKHIELIKAFSVFKKQTGLPHRLVLAGSEGAYSDAVHREAASSPYASDIFLTGYFPHESLPELYSCADACVFPSVSEGVGLPVIEAMACGIPVACAKAGALPEIAGSHALFFNPDDIEDMAAGMQAVVTDPALREKAVAGGIEWTQRFSWEKTAERTLDVLTGIGK
ncbi:glycosyltransferase family 4 protein [Treponema brennaborense]|uniref:Glycosyl transferase group 1 n=1 Tax=Treponema brennaborense (strain DSM 12168 / CIP 105900 / DD5/3) TaxID=906968 RepID=F4LPE0_TREBD|nr:glycosyltransferase family 1 protein [Treponema brennaborense]AEE17002.1 glycosyl transferase group 1 [Treponema brennaborense DSM 12168]